ncbi:MAG TPA: N-methyl-L-tryptophan oxidase [Candidatus Eremiobacteraceae bacterium]
MIYDVVVVGLGVMGSSIAASCARRGRTVLGIERFWPVHDRGASHGKTRLIRQAYFEHVAYVPLVLRSYALWRELEARSGEHLMTITGLLLAGKESTKVIAGSRRSAEQHGLPVEYLTASDIARRFPMTRPHADEVGVFEREGGVIFPELAVHALLRVAADAGAQMRFGVRVTDWHRTGTGGLRVAIDDGTAVEAKQVVLSVGPWLESMTAQTGIPLKVQRNVQAWFAPRTPEFTADRFPAFLLDREGFPNIIYGFPDLGDGVKAAFHSRGSFTKPDQLERGISEDDIVPIQTALAGWLPDAGQTFLNAKACMYTLTPDEHFAIGRHPADADVIVAGGFSGHGFKFAPVVGEIVSELLFDGSSRFDIAFLSPDRFSHAI